MKHGPGKAAPDAANLTRQNLATMMHAGSAQATKSPANLTPQRLWGLLTRKERWGLSWCGWLVLALIGLSMFGLLLAGIYPFLAITNRVDANVLVVEGWIHDYAICASVEEFKTGSYERVFSTGGPVTGSGAYNGDQDTAASVGASLLRKAGMPAESLQMVPAHLTGRDRTYSSAVALREWFQEHKLPVGSINVVTEGVHARRTQRLFQEAFGNSVRVGIIAVPNPDYAPRRWWLYSEGVRDVLGEGIAYAYARLFFHPSEPKNKFLPAGEKTN
jgi:uncharacterized SAM-binding protein YcdF (DUF218 family)